MQITTYSTASELWLAYERGLRAYVRRRTGDDALAEELTHRVLLKVVDSCCSGREVRNEGAWLFQITRNVLVDYRKERGGDARLPGDLSEDTTTDVWQQLGHYVAPLLGLLPESYALPLRLADIERIPQREIAERLGLGLSATKSRIQRGRLMLRAKIAECTYLETDAAGRPLDFTVREDCAPLQGPASTSDCSSCR